MFVLPFYIYSFLFFSFLFSPRSAEHSITNLLFLTRGSRLMHSRVAMLDMAQQQLSPSQNSRQLRNPPVSPWA